MRVQVLSIDGIDTLYAIKSVGSRVVRLGMVGDLVFGSNWGNRQRKPTTNCSHWVKTKSLSRALTLPLGNVECFVSETITPRQSNGDQVVRDFVTSSESLDGLVEFDSVRLANGHAGFSNLDLAPVTFYQPFRHLEHAGIAIFGPGTNLEEARRTHVIESDGVSLAFFGVDGVTANIDFTDGE